MTILRQMTLIFREHMSLTINVDVGPWWINCSTCCSRSRRTTFISNKSYLDITVSIFLSSIDSVHQGLLTFVSAHNSISSGWHLDFDRRISIPWFFCFCHSVVISPLLSQFEVSLSCRTNGFSNISGAAEEFMVDSVSLRFYGRKITPHHQPSNSVLYSFC